MQTLTQPRHQMYLGLAGWMLVTIVAACIGAVGSMDAADFYGQLTLPSWAPSASVFAPVWTILYLLMGYSAWLVWMRVGGDAAYIALTLFLVQLALNALWSWFFFDWHLGALAFADISLLWLVVVSMSIAFWRHCPVAALMQIPYLLWLTFAAALNYEIWHLNPELLA